jgi:hypothetical protein
MIEREVPTVLVGMKLVRKEDDHVVEEAEKFAAETPRLNAHIPSCSPLCRISVSDVYLTVAVMTIDKKARTPPRRRSSSSSHRSCPSNASSDTDIMSSTSLSSSAHSLPYNSGDSAPSSTSKSRRSSSSRVIQGATRSLSNLYEKLSHSGTSL